MAPNQKAGQTAIQNDQMQPTSKGPKSTTTDNYEYKVVLVWRNIILMTLLHIAGLYGLKLMFTGQMYFSTVVFHILYGYAAGTGITGGAHRLWAHKSYKARWPLRVLLAYMQAAAFQNSIHEWVRDHRVHHKFCDTNADPHNSKRGFFFSHMGWLMVRKHRDVKEKGKTIDMSDLEKDWVVMFQKKYFLIIMPMCWLVIPSIIPWYFWGENYWYSFYGCFGRYILDLHGTWFVNSLAHMWGDKPFDKNLSASNNLFVAIVALGEGWHNYHHCFPWDYRTSEIWNVNSTTKFINFFAKIGWAYDLKEASDDLIRRKALRCGDGSELMAKGEGKGEKKYMKQAEESILNPHTGELWGFDDKDMTQQERNLIIIKNKKVK